MGVTSIYAGGKSVDLQDFEHRLKLDPAMVAREEQDFEGPKNAREEKIKQRNQKLAEAKAKGEVPVVNGGTSKKKILSKEEEARLMKMYREQVLKEPPAPKLIQIAGNGGIAAAPAPAKQEEETGVAGD